MRHTHDLGSLRDQKGRWTKGEKIRHFGTIRQIGQLIYAQYTRTKILIWFYICEIFMAKSWCGAARLRERDPWPSFNRPERCARFEQAQWEGANDRSYTPLCICSDARGRFAKLGSGGRSGIRADLLLTPFPVLASSTPLAPDDDLYRDLYRAHHFAVQPLPGGLQQPARNVRRIGVHVTCSTTRSTACWMGAGCVRSASGISPASTDRTRIAPPTTRSSPCRRAGEWIRTRSLRTRSKCRSIPALRPTTAQVVGPVWSQNETFLLGYRLNIFSLLDPRWVGV